MVLAISSSSSLKGSAGFGVDDLGGQDARGSTETDT
jgi:hypothetical protein